MWTIVAPLMMCALGQAPNQPPADSRVRAIAPFVDSSVLGVVHIDLTRADFPAMVARLSGGRSPGSVADVSKLLLAWSEGLRRAGEKDLFVIVNASDLPGLPLVVVPLAAGADAAEIGRLFCGGGKQPPPISFPTCATLHNAVTAGTPAALDRLRRASPAPRPEFADAFAALGAGSIGLRVLVSPSADARRVLEELVPILPGELGGGPITAYTQGILWAAVGLDAGPKPSLRLVVACPTEEAANSLEHLGQTLALAVERSPALQSIGPDFVKFTRELKAEVLAKRVSVTADAEVAAGIIDSILRPVRQGAIQAQCANNEKQIGLAIHNYISRHKNTFPPAYSTDKAGKPLLSWRVLILPYLDELALYREFHLDEPWDSAHNRALIAKMPQAYRCPMANADAAREGKTRYVAPRNPGAIFRGAEPVKISEVTDGTSNTIMVLDAGDERAVTWTKPDDWEVPPGDKLAPAMILTAHTGRVGPGTTCAFADGSVRFLHPTIKPATLRSLFTYSGGEVISNDDN